MSSFFILSIACMAASELPDLGSLSIWPSTSGTICHETPNRSFSQPQGPSSPPLSVSLVQYPSTSCCVLQVTMRDMPSENEKVGPPSKARYSRPSSSKVALRSLPLAIGPSFSLLCKLSKRFRANRVQPLPALRPGYYEDAVLEDRQLPRHSGLADVDHLDQLANRSLAAAQRVDDPSPGRVGQNLEHVGHRHILLQRYISCQQYVVRKRRVRAGAGRAGPRRSSP